MMTEFQTVQRTLSMSEKERAELMEVSYFFFITLYAGISLIIGPILLMVTSSLNTVSTP